MPLEVAFIIHRYVTTVKIKTKSYKISFKHLNNNKSK